MVSSDAGSVQNRGDARAFDGEKQSGRIVGSAEITPDISRARLIASARRDDKRGELCEKQIGHEQKREAMTTPWSPASRLAHAKAIQPREDRCLYRPLSAISAIFQAKAQFARKRLAPARQKAAAYEFRTAAAALGA